MKIRVFTTGGTIDKVYYDAKSEYEIGEPVVEQILRQALSHLDCEITALMRKDSLDLDDADREKIRQAVESSPDSRVIITHGTDTMVDTASVLKDLPGKTIVLTGSLSPARFQDSDAIFNVGCAIAAVQTLPAGVYITMNGYVFDADKVRKNREANRFEEI